MAERSGLSQTAVLADLAGVRAAAAPVETWKLSKDPQFIEKVRDIVGLYLNPPERAVVLCVDEKTQIQALDRTAPMLPMLPGTPERATHDYKRHGTTSLYAALNIATGKVIGSLHARHRAVEFKKFLKTIDRARPGRARRARRARQRLHPQDPGDQTLAARAPPLRLHFTPTCARWLNLVERWFAELTTESSAAARTAPSASSTPTSATGSRPGTRTPAPTSGPRPPTRSSNRSPATANESTNHDTRCIAIPY